MFVLWSVQLNPSLIILLYLSWNWVTFMELGHFKELGHFHGTGSLSWNWVTFGSFRQHFSYPLVSPWIFLASYYLLLEKFCFYRLLSRRDISRSQIRWTRNFINVGTGTHLIFVTEMIFILILLSVVGDGFCYDAYIVKALFSFSSSFK